MAEYLAANTQLEYIGMVGVSTLPASSWQVILSAVTPSHQLRQLGLASCELGTDFPTEALQQLLETSTTLERLDLSYNEDGLGNWEPILQGIRASKAPLIEVPVT